MLLDTQEIDGFIYEIHEDESDVIDDIDFESEEDRLSYFDKFERGILSSYGVVKLSKCECCGAAKDQLDSLWSIHAESCEEALQFYIEYAV